MYSEQSKRVYKRQWTVYILEQCTLFNVSCTRWCTAALYCSAWVYAVYTVYRVYAINTVHRMYTVHIVYILGQCTDDQIYRVCLNVQWSEYAYMYNEHRMPACIRVCLYVQYSDYAYKYSAYSKHPRTVDILSSV